MGDRVLRRGEVDNFIFQRTFFVRGTIFELLSSYLDLILLTANIAYQTEWWAIKLHADGSFKVYFLNPAPFSEGRGQAWGNAERGREVSDFLSYIDLCIASICSSCIWWIWYLSSYFYACKFGAEIFRRKYSSLISIQEITGLVYVMECCSD